MHDFQDLLTNMDHGQCTSGSFIRRAVDKGPTIAFDQLIIRTCGSEFSTTEPKDNEAFFKRVDYTGYGTQSGYAASEHRNRYETIGNWRCIK